MATTPGHTTVTVSPKERGRPSGGYKTTEKAPTILKKKKTGLRGDMGHGPALEGPLRPSLSEKEQAQAQLLAGNSEKHLVFSLCVLFWLLPTDNFPFTTVI